MKCSIFYILSIFFLVSCNKDKYTSAPQITFKSINPNVWISDNTSQTDGPILSLHLTDAEGDFGFQVGEDTSYVYLKTYLNNEPISNYDADDSLEFPDLTGIDRKNLSVDVNVLLNQAFVFSSRPRPFVDTLTFDVYVKDFGKNKSNVIRTSTPVYYFSP